jgi:hypothetical protein
MPEAEVKLSKLFESLNKGLYKTNKVMELYKPMNEVIEAVSQDIKQLEDLSEKEPLFNQMFEEEIKRRELITLYKKMQILINNLKDEMDNYQRDINLGNVFLEKFRTYRTIVFENSKKSKEYLRKIIDSFNIEEFNLKFSVVGTIDLNNIATHIGGRKVGIDVIFPASNIDLIFDEVLKSQNLKFRLSSENFIIYFEKDNILHLEAPSKKIKLADSIAKEFDGKLIDE